MFSKLYKALVRPITEYADIIWGHYILFNQRKLEKNAASYNKVGTSLRDKQYHHHLVSQYLWICHLCLTNIFEAIFLCDLINNRFKLGCSLPFYTILKDLHQRRFTPPTQAISSLSLVSTCIIDFNGLQASPLPYRFIAHLRFSLHVRFKCVQFQLNLFW